jgi:hypothetical protein
MNSSSIPLSFFPAVRTACLALVMGVPLLLGACAAPVAQIDYTAFRASHPRSILVMPPVNQSPEPKATLSFLAAATVPLAEAGYYVIPVALADQTFKQNGVTVAEEAQAIKLDKLRKIFGADAALYITITRYGVSYRVISSAVEAAASAKLIDLRTGQELWSGHASVVLQNNNSGGGLAGILIGAVVDQIVNTVSDQSYKAGRMADYQMLSAGYKNSILYGPYHPKFATD